MTTHDQFTNYVLPTYGRFPIVPDKAQGTHLWDSEGNKYLDFCTGIAVCSIGHCHPRLTQAIQEQASKLMHCSNLYEIAEQGELAQTIVEDFVKIPGKIFFANSGAEANEGLVKLARKFGHTKPAASGEARHEIITFGNSFHGRTMGSLSATGQPAIQQGFAPILEGMQYAEFNHLESVKALISDKTAAILLEPVQGEGGVNPANAEFLNGLAALCKEHDLLLMFDEVQAGFGRLGEDMAWRAIAPELEPDAISWAKGMGGGFPIGAFWISDRRIDPDTTLSSQLGPKTHGSTYGGNPLACAASLAVLAEIKEAGLCDNVKAREAQIRSAIESWNHPAISELRGKGLLLGFGLNPEALTFPYGQTSALALVLKLTELGLLTVPAGADTLRWLPPLNVTEEEVDQALALLKQALEALSA
ncbi:aspartate aminotransferase family protein [Rubritalea marina]|uniref:aspartate aminotransferase family protein n=1 Tax=Rubritalea marina TaxID=361055 RepID=UPI0003621AF4|nr:acetylornithine/succinylornithine family transaminase [Rubritalea marina]